MIRSLIFITSSLFLSVALLFALRVDIGSHSVEKHILNWSKNSKILDQIQKEAQELGKKIKRHGFSTSLYDF